MKRSCTVGELRKVLEGLPDDTIVLEPYSDHAYRLVGGSVMNVAKTKERGDWVFYEWFGDPKHFDGPPVEVVKAVVIS